MIRLDTLDKVRADMIRFDTFDLIRLLVGTSRLDTGLLELSYEYETSG